MRRSQRRTKPGTHQEKQLQRPIILDHPHENLERRKEHHQHQQHADFQKTAIDHPAHAALQQKQENAKKRSCQIAPNDLEAEETEKHEESTPQSDVLENCCSPAEKGIPKRKTKKPGRQRQKIQGFEQSVPFLESNLLDTCRDLYNTRNQKSFCLHRFLGSHVENRYPDKLN